MITILHGDNIVASRNRRLIAIEAACTAEKEVFVVDGKEANLTDLIQSFEAQSLFAKDRLVVVDNLISSLKSKDRKESIMGYLLKGAFSADAVLWEGSSVGRSLLKLSKQKHVRVEQFKTPQVIFKLVESFFPGNKRQVFSYFEQAAEKEPVEFVFAMLVRQIRLLLGIFYSAPISELQKMASWQKSRLHSQVRHFSHDTLHTLYKELLTIDYQIKTGRSALPLTNRIERIIMKL